MSVDVLVASAPLSIEHEEPGLSSHPGKVLVLRDWFSCSKALWPREEHPRDSTQVDWNGADPSLFHLPPHFLGKNFFRKSMKSLMGNHLNTINWGFSKRQNDDSKGSFARSRLLPVGLLEISGVKC